MARHLTYDELEGRVRTLEQENRDLRQGEDRFRSVYENSMDAIFLTAPDGRVFSANPAACEMTGYSEKELVEGGRNVVAVPTDPRLPGALAERRAKGFYRGELNFRRKDGSTFPVELTSAVFKDKESDERNVIIARDITDRVEAEEEVRQTRDLLFAILDNAPVLIYVNGTDHRYRLVNRAWEHFSGKRAEKVTGRTPRDLFSARTAERFEEGNRRVMETGSTLVYEESVLRQDKRSSFHTTKFPLMGPEGRIEAVGGISIDISTLKHAEEELLAAQKQLFQAQKMETLGTLVAGVAHEINNPINLIMFNVALLQKIWRDVEPILEKESLVEPDKRYGGLPHAFLKRDLVSLLQDMEMAANRVASVTRGLKEYSAKTDVMEKKSLPLNEAVQNSLRLAQATLRKSGTRLEIHLAENLPPMIGNLQAVEQVVMNLLTNAVQAIRHERGEITVHTGFDKDRGLVHVTVRDNGKGIDPLISSRIFDPFFTDRQAEGGTGLGLAVSYSLVKAHGGEITFESEVGKGTAFRAGFPVGDRKPPVRILAVDDEDLFLKVIREALMRVPGCEVETASNGTEALLRLGSSPPDLLILDLLMPGMDGLEVMQALRRRPEFSGLRVVIVTGLSDDPRLKEIRSLGVSEVFAKPLRVVEFVKKVEQILDKEEG